MDPRIYACGGTVCSQGSQNMSKAQRLIRTLLGQLFGSLPLLAHGPLGPLGFTASFAGVSVLLGPLGPLGFTASFAGVSVLLAPDSVKDARKMRETRWTQWTQCLWRRTHSKVRERCGKTQWTQWTQCLWRCNKLCYKM